MAEAIVFFIFVVLLVIMYYKNKSETEKRLIRIKKKTNNWQRELNSSSNITNIRRKTKVNKQSHYQKELSKPKYR